jgi:hypothetical protein
MKSPDPDPTSKTSGAGTETDDGNAPDVEPSRRRVWGASLTAAVAASLVAWMITESTKGVFQPRRELTEVMGLTTMRPTGTTQAAADFKNRLLSLAIFGGILPLSCPCRRVRSRSGSRLSACSRARANASTDSRRRSTRAVVATTNLTLCVFNDALLLGLATIRSGCGIGIGPPGLRRTRAIRARLTP